MAGGPLNMHISGISKSNVKYHGARIVSGPFEECNRAIPNQAGIRPLIQEIERELLQEH